MSSASFPSKNQNLEAVRAIAASLVLIGHMLSVFPELAKRKNHFTNFIGNWGTESVIIFFILSGIVMNSAVQRRHRDTSQFLFERIVRIHPILLITLISCLIIEKSIFNTLPSLVTILGNIIPLGTLQGYIVEIFWKTNPAMWTLSFEISFYFIFGLFVIRKGNISQLNMLIWSGLSLISIYIYHYPIYKQETFLHFVMIMAYSSTWILGFYIWEFKTKLKSSFLLATLSLLCLPLLSRAHFSSIYFDPMRNLLFALTSIPLFLYLIQGEVEQRRKDTLVLLSLIILPFSISLCFIIPDPSYNFGVKVLYCICPLLLLPINFFKSFILQFYKKYCERFLVKLGSISYALYLTHIPLLTVLASIAVIPIWIRIILFFPLTYGISFVLERKVQPIFNSILKKQSH